MALSHCVYVTSCAGPFRRPVQLRPHGAQAAGEAPRRLHEGVGAPARSYCGGFLSFSMTWLRLKEPGFWRGGKSLKLWIHRAAYPMAGPTRNA